MDDDQLRRLKKLLDEQGKFHKIWNEHSAIQKLTQEHKVLTNIIDAQKPYLDVLKAASLVDSTITKQLDRFKIPGLSEAERIANGLKMYHSSFTARFAEEIPNFQKTILSVKAPWLDVLRATESIRGFAELQAIGHA